MYLSGKKEGQTATEYIIVVAIVIIIALILISVNSQVTFIDIIGFSNDASLKTKRPISIEQHVFADEYAYFTLMNNEVSTARIDEILLDDIVCNITDENQGAKSTYLEVGEQDDFYCYNVKTNSSFNYDLSITYTNIDKNTQYTENDMQVKGGVQEFATAASGSQEVAAPVPVNPSNLALSHSTRSKSFSVSWDAGENNNGTGGCQLEYYDGSAWQVITAASSVNCDANVSSQSFSLNGDGWKSSWDGTQVRLVRVFDNALVGNFSETLSCTTTSYSSSSTPTIDEDCDGNWDDTGTVSVSGCGGTGTCAWTCPCWVTGPESWAGTGNDYLVCQPVTSGYDCSQDTVYGWVEGCVSGGVWEAYFNYWTYPSGDACGERAYARREIADSYCSHSVTVYR